MDRLTMGEAVRRALVQEMADDGSVFAYGEGINDPSGFFGCTVGLAEAFGPDRCFDVPNAEEMLTGFGVGAAIGGMRPVFFNLRIEFLLLAANQLVNHAAKWGSMQGRPVPVPFTAVAMIGRGWGQGAQHSGSYASMFAHVPGLEVVMPSSPARAAAAMVAAVRSDGPVLVLLPRAVADGEDDLPDPIAPLELGRATTVRAGHDFTIVAVGDGVGLALEAADVLAPDGIEVEVVDTGGFSPLDGEAVRASVGRTGRLGVLDVGWATYGLAAEVARAVLSGPAPVLRTPMRSWAPTSHAPAGAFAEAGHYPDLAGVVADVRTAVQP